MHSVFVWECIKCAQLKAAINILYGWNILYTGNYCVLSSVDLCIYRRQKNANIWNEYNLLHQNIEKRERKRRKKGGHTQQIINVLLVWICELTSLIIKLCVTQSKKCVHAARMKYHVSSILRIFFCWNPLVYKYYTWWQQHQWQQR